MRKIALIPVFNEETTLLSVLEPLSTLVDVLIVVDDGSRDRSLELAESWSRRWRHVRILCLPENRGMSSALREGFLYLAARLSAGDFDSEDLVLTLDADGQHDAREILALCEHVEREGLDVALTRRDFSLYPVHKRLGNSLMTLWARVWSGFPYSDVESGFRAMRLKVIPPVLDYYTGFRYSCAQEIAILSARLGFRVANDFHTVIQLYRSQRQRATFSSMPFSAFGRLPAGRVRRKVGDRPPVARLVVTSDSL